MKYPLISVIINIHNGAEYINQSISSVLMQNYANLELIIYNNHSTDDTLKIINNYAISNNKIKVYSSLTPTKIPLYAARNVALEFASGEYISFLDSDDLWDKNKTLNQYLYMIKHNFKISCTNFYLMNDRQQDRDTTIVHKYLPEGYVIDRILNHNFIHLSSILFHREIANFKFDDNLTILGDIDFLVRVNKHFSIGSLNEYLTIYRYHSCNTGLIENYRYFDEGIYLLNKLLWINPTISRQFKKKVYWNKIINKLSLQHPIDFIDFYNVGFKNKLKVIIYVLLPKFLSRYYLKNRRNSLI